MLTPLYRYFINLPISGVGFVERRTSEAGRESRWPIATSPAAQTCSCLTTEALLVPGQSPLILDPQSGTLSVPHGDGFYVFQLLRTDTRG